MEPNATTGLVIIHNSTIELHFVRNDYAQTLIIVLLYKFLTNHPKFAFFPSFLYERDTIEHLNISIYLSF